MRCENSRKVLLAAAALLFASPVVFAQGQGQGGPGGQGRQRPTTTQQQQQRQTGTASGTQERQRIRATDRQRDQLRTCTQTADRIRQQARDMDRQAKSGSFNADRARQQRDQLREQVRTMEEQHQQLMNGMSEDQKTALRTRTEEMNRIHERVNAQLGRLDEELGKPEPNRKQVAETAQRISRDMNQWREQYRKMETEMSVQP